MEECNISAIFYFIIKCVYLDIFSYFVFSYFFYKKLSNITILNCLLKVVLEFNFFFFYNTLSVCY